MSTIHYWSDLHLGHAFVAGLRSFNSPTEHDTYIQDTWQTHVTPKDQIWILGDISGGRTEQHALEIISKLNGRKHLISGNHDSVASIHRNAWKQQAKFHEVFASVQDYAKHQVGKTRFLLSHYPYAGDHEGRGERFAEFRLKDVGIPLVHGHIHDRWSTTRTVLGTPMRNVGVDRAPTPVTIQSIHDWLSAEN